MSAAPIEFETLGQFDQHLRDGRPLAGCVFQGLDLRAYTAALTAAPLGGAAFLGCQLEDEALTHATRQLAIVLPSAAGLPYQAYPSALYTIEGALYAGYVPGEAGSYAETLDARVYRHFVETGGEAPPSLLESLHRRLHDHGMSDALEEALAGKRVVAVMGGHRLARNTREYADVARIGRSLAREGFLVLSGGGPGAMEAAHLGVWMARRPDDDLFGALGILAEVPIYQAIEPWLDTAFAVKRRYPPLDGAPFENIGIPTWHYGHEPPNVFPTAVAKYFANSEREDGLLAVARHGVIFTPGSAGTIQEVFQDAAQNHYAAPPGFPSPMVFYGENYWRRIKPVFPLLERLASGHAYASLLHLSDSVEVIVDRIVRFARERDEVTRVL